MRDLHAIGVKHARPKITSTSENGGFLGDQSTASILLNGQEDHAVAVMNQTFQPLIFAGLIEDRCHLVDGPVTRIYFQLSQPPPLGWSHLFNLAWLAMPHSVPRRIGIEGDSIWIECVPSEVLTHLPELEAAMDQANAGHIAAMQRRDELVRQRQELEAQTRSQLAALAEQLNPQPLHSASPFEDDERPKRSILTATKSVWQNIRVMLGRPS